MPLYRVTWEIDIEADTPRDAAEEALTVQRNPESIATVFDVSIDGAPTTTRIDLTEGTIEEVSRG